MIRQVVKLVSPGVFLPFYFEEDPTESQLIIKPTTLAICAADQRYFQGNRAPEILRRKLPMSLIHEGIGEVVYDPEKKLAPGSSVIMLPFGSYSDISQNYQTNAFFRSSNADGFLQEFLFLNRNEILPIETSPSKHFVFAEMLSVCFQGIRQIPVSQWQAAKTVGVWGDGIMGYLMSYCIKHKYPHLHVTIFGKDDTKLLRFTHCDNHRNILYPGLPNDQLDIACECVGGNASADAIDHAISLMNPQGTICLMGVSESKVSINTRQILEKGLHIIGSSRSVLDDFMQARDLLQNSPDFSWLDKVISEEIQIRDICALTEAFKRDQIHAYKTLLHWEM